MIQTRWIAIFLILISMTALAERTKLKPATNDPPQDDIKLGLAAAAEAEKQLVLIQNPDANSYITSLGNSLVAKAPTITGFLSHSRLSTTSRSTPLRFPAGPSMSTAERSKPQTTKPRSPV